MGRSPIQGVLPRYLTGFIALEVNSDSEQVRGPKRMGVEGAAANKGADLPVIPTSFNDAVSS
jgi:hypothetical protein